MNLQPILDLLRQRTGIDPATLGSQAVSSVLSARLRETGLDPVAYAQRLRGDSTAFLALLEELVIPETWFFRGGEIFSWLTDHLAALPLHSSIRILSLPCSTGEEPYSLAITLSQRGLLSRCFLLGVDISSRNIDAARRAVFGEFSFRQTSPEVRSQYFRKIEAGWELNATIRNKVSFQVGNLHDLGLLALDRPYDLIFCRNLFIYLTPQARQSGLTSLASLLSLGGLLVMGHAEALDSAETRFEAVGPPGYFLYRRTNRHKERSSPVLITHRSVVQSPLLPPPPETLSLTARLTQAQNLADSGRYPQALELCLSLQQQFGPSAEIYYLMGIIHEAKQERTEALANFNKALYLVPEHRAALLHLMLLYQHEGDTQRAGLLRSRLERLSTKEVS
jgi:chemotaxis protein methyltransferase WspC